VGEFLFVAPAYVLVVNRLSPPLNPTPAFPPPGILLQSWIVFELPKKLSFLALVREDGRGGRVGYLLGVCVRVVSRWGDSKPYTLNPDP